jgi:hypothetical protein
MMFIISATNEAAKLNMPLLASRSATLQTGGLSVERKLPRSDELPVTLPHDHSLAEGAPEKEPEGGHPTGIGRAHGSPKLPSVAEADQAAQRSPNGGEGSLQASEASVWVNGRLSDGRTAT